MTNNYGSVWDEAIPPANSDDDGDMQSCGVTWINGARVKFEIMRRSPRGNGMYFKSSAYFKIEDRARIN